MASVYLFKGSLYEYAGQASLVHESAINKQVAIIIKIVVLTGKHLGANFPLNVNCFGFPDIKVYYLISSIESMQKYIRNDRHC
jgi:hypothetical protein